MNIQKTINVKGSLIDLSTPKVMGIINVTPDSFYAGSRKSALTEILNQAEKILADGATFIDVGGYSSRPGAADISPEEELTRIKEPISEISRLFPELIVSVDTFRGEVAREAIENGASIINDISGGDLDSKMFDLIVEMKVPYVMMHMKGTPQNMAGKNKYDDLLKEIVKSFVAKIDKFHERGIKDIMIDPGFGFAKNVEQNFQLLKRLEYLKCMDKPVLVGLSRKSMIYKSLNTEADMALNGTTVLNTVALLKGVSILRVHDVKEASEAIQLINLLKN